MPELLSVETAVPSHVLGREDTHRLLPALAGGDAQAVRFRATIDGTRVRARNVILPPEDLVRIGGVTERTRYYERHALTLGEAVARRALVAAHADPAGVVAVISVSCTGYLLPSLDAYLIQRLGIAPTARRLPITELGCSAGVAAVGIATRFTQGDPAGPALIVCVELCSLCVQTSEPDDSAVIGNLLFGDAAAAAVVGPADDVDDARGPEILANGSVLWPGTTEMLGMRLTDTGLRLILSAELPIAIRQHLPRSVHGFLRAHGLSTAEVSFWSVHTGGPKVLEAVGETLGLPDRLLQPSWQVLERVGNVSSASVFFSLRVLQESSPPRPGSYGLLVAFGPGLSCELALVRARGWLGQGS